MSTSTENTTFANISVPKSNLTMEQDEFVSNGSDVEKMREAAAAASAAPKKTPVKRKATPKKTASKEDDDEPAEPITPKPAKKRAPAKKKETEVNSEVQIEDEYADSGDEDAAYPATPAKAPHTAAPSSKKRIAKTDKGEIETPIKKRKTKAEANGDTETPTKTPKAKAIPTPKKRGSKFPESFNEFSEGDKLLVRMRKENKTWPEVEAAWTKVTNEVPGKDVLRKREAKLRPLAQQWKAGDALKLAEFKAHVEKEKWGRIADMFKSAGSEYSGAGVQKKWEMLVKKGEVDDAGNYVGTDIAAPKATEGSDTDVEAPAGAEMKEHGDADVENEDGSEVTDTDADKVDA